MNILINMLLPPLGLITIAILGMGLSLIWRKFGLWLTTISLVGLLLCSVPAVSGNLVNMLQSDPPILPDELEQTTAEAEAVVVLAGGHYPLAEEYGGQTTNAFSLERARYAAWIVKRTNLPLIISGGRVRTGAKSEGALMQELLQNEFNLSGDCYVEEQSRTTYENAKFTAEFLKKNDIQKVVLVTHAWHMQRAKFAFEHFDIEVIPAPTAFNGRNMDYYFYDFMPALYDFNFSGLAFHELFGQWWYKMRYY